MEEGYVDRHPFHSFCVAAMRDTESDRSLSAVRAIASVGHSATIAFVTVLECDRFQRVLRAIANSGA
ncbi:hypothetical protein NIES4074_65610 (plasmid) [Cylindrospermum sp. NIES-4074]|nr:hypothetical protein NIES4074_65610 [Cylindrospermum sp. NIES-4074]